MNEACNFLLRHYSDFLYVSLHSKIPGSDHDHCIFRVKAELNDLELNEEKLSLMLVATSPMRNKSTGALIYYTVELDLLFKVRMQSDKELDSYEIAL